MQGNYSRQTLFEILLQAASKHDSIEHTTKSLEGTPSGKTIHYHLDKLEDMSSVEHQMNQALQSRLPERIINRKHHLAIDLHLLPYYGKASTSE